VEEVNRVCVGPMIVGSSLNLRQGWRGMMNYTGSKFGLWNV
jgi:hypothetical protein